MEHILDFGAGAENACGVRSHLRAVHTFCFATREGMREVLLKLDGFFKPAAWQKANVEDGLMLLQLH